MGEYAGAFVQALNRYRESNNVTDLQEMLGCWVCQDDSSDVYASEGGLLKGKVANMIFGGKARSRSLMFGTKTTGHFDAAQSRMAPMGSLRTRGGTNVDEQMVGDAEGMPSVESEGE